MKTHFQPVLLFWNYSISLALKEVTTSGGLVKINPIVHILKPAASLYMIFHEWEPEPEPEPEPGLKAKENLASDEFDQDFRSMTFNLSPRKSF